MIRLTPLSHPRTITVWWQITVIGRCWTAATDNHSERDCESGAKSTPVSGERPDPEPSNGLEVLQIAGGQSEMALQGCCGDQGVGHAQPELASYAAGALGNCTVDRDLPEGGKDTGRQIGARGTREELSTSDHGVVEPVAAGLEFNGAA